MVVPVGGPNIVGEADELTGSRGSEITRACADDEGMLERFADRADECEKLCARIACG